MKKYNSFTATVALLFALSIAGSQGRAAASPPAPWQSKAPIASSATEATGTCVPSLTVACVQGNRFQLSVYFGELEYAYVAASSSESAVFYFPGSSSDWQVVAKVLNGCSSTSYWWVFAAGATSTAYTVQIKDTVTDTDYYFSELCPLENEHAIPCP